MSRMAKVMAVLVGAALIVVLGTGVMVAGTVVTTGLVTVSVHEEGPDGLDLYIPVPAGLVEASLVLAPVALRLAGHSDIDHGLEHVGVELDEVLPAIEAILHEIDEMPDAVLVEVEDSGGHVRVSKERGSIRIVVHDGGDRITVSVPTRVFRSLGGLLAG